MSVMTAADYRAKVAAAMTEAQLLEQVRALATALGWRIYHTHDSRRSPAGFPDLVMVRGGRLLFVELKATRGRYGPGQVEWLDDLTDVAAGSGDVVEALTWRPADLLDGTIEAILRGLPGNSQEHAER